MNAEQLIRDGDLADALKALQEQQIPAGATVYEAQYHG